MKGLRCTTANCEHNKCEHCLAGVVDINEKGVCKSKIKRDGGALAQLFDNYESATAFDFTENENIVQCAADCIYNLNSECTRERLLVEDGVIKTKCADRRKDELVRD